MRDCAKRVGIPDLVNPQTGRVRGVSPHRLGDTFSVHAMKLDNSDDVLRLLQEHLVHASFNTTAKYQKVAGEEHREWYDNLYRVNPPPFSLPEFAAHYCYCTGGRFSPPVLDSRIQG